MRKKLLIIGNLVLGLALCAIPVMAAKMEENHSAVMRAEEKREKENRLTDLKGKKKELLEEGKVTKQDVRNSIGVLEEIDSLEKELYPEEYYKDQLEGKLYTAQAAVTDMEIGLKFGNVPKNKIIESKDRIAKIGAFADKYITILESGQCDSYEKLYKQVCNEDEEMMRYFETQYRLAED